MRACKLAVFLIVLWFASGCLHKKDYNFVVEGEVKNAPQNTYARFYKALPTGQELLDSVPLHNGRFKFFGKTSYPDFFIVNFSGKNYNIYLLIDSADHITITADYNDILRSYKVHGSALSDSIRMLEQHLAQTRSLLDSLTNLYQFYKNRSVSDSAELLDSLIKDLLNRQKQFSAGFVYRHYNSLVALPALSQVYVPGHGIFSPLDDADLYFMVDSALGRKYPNNPHVLRMHTFVMNIKAALKRRQARALKIMPGAKAPDFELKDYNQQIVSLSNKNYNYLLFCGVWCKTCKPAIDQALTLTDKLNVIIFCLATDRQQIDSLLQNNPSLTKARFVPLYRLWNEPIVRKYEVTRLPTSFLISPQGEILFINPDSEQLRKYY